MAVIYLPLDTTRQAVANRIVGEAHTLVNRAVRIAVAEYGAFYADSLVVHDVATGKALTKKQFRAGEMLIEETARYGRRICTVVLITDSTVSNSIKITYQALGDWNNYSKARLNEELLNLGDGSEGIDWNNIVDKPLRFDPAPHLHHVSEVYGTEYLRDAVMRIRDAATVTEQPIRVRMADYIKSTMGKAVDTIDSTTASLLAAHRADPDPHPQYAKPTDLVPTMSLVRKPRGVTPANGAVDVLLETVFQGSEFYSLFGVAQKAAQFHVATKPDFSDIRLLETLNGPVQKFQQDGLLAGSKIHYWRVRYQDVDDVWSDWSTTNQFTTKPDYPKKGTILSTWCEEIELWGKIADGRNGSTDELLNAKSPECGYVPPDPAGTVKAEFCKGVDKWRTYADGNYGTYDALYQKNSLDCGYVPPPAAGTVLKEYCKGLDKMRDIADGVGGYNTVLYERNSTACGYVPPIPKGTELRRYCSGYTLHVVYADGNYGETDVVKELKSTECGYVPPPAAGTVLRQYCRGVDKYHEIANGDGTSREQLVEQNSTFCGYVPPAHPAAGTIIGYECQGYDKYNKVANGSGGYTLALAQRNAQVCGYSPPPAGTVLQEFCSGRDMWRRYADGNDGHYDQLYQAKSTSCGYIAPTLAKPTWNTPQDSVYSNRVGAFGAYLNDMVVVNNDGDVTWQAIEWNAYNSAGQWIEGGRATNSSFSTKTWAYVSDGKLANHQSYTIYARFVSNGAGTSPWSDAYRFTTNWYEHPANGTYLSSFCSGYNKYDRYANGSGGSYDVHVESNSPYCGWVNPVDQAGWDAIPTEIYASMGQTPASFILSLLSDGSWTTRIRFGTPNQSGRYLSGTANGWEVLFQPNPESMNYGEGDPWSSVTPDTWVSLANGCSVQQSDSTDVMYDFTGTGGVFYLSIRHTGYGIQLRKRISYSLDGGCFAVGTVMLTPEGDRLAEELAIGDIVNSFSEPTMLDMGAAGWTDWQIEDTSNINVGDMSLVTENYQFVAKESVKLNGLHSTLTHVHFVYSAATESYGWKKARDVIIGDAFIDVNRNLIPIVSIEQVDTPTTFVKLNVEDVDTLQVKLGDTYILTHNES